MVMEPLVVVVLQMVDVMLKKKGFGDGYCATGVTNRFGTTDSATGVTDDSGATDNAAVENNIGITVDTDCSTGCTTDDIAK